jgi:Flp pilus assembly protein TadG
MMRGLRLDRSGSSAAEFALVLPLLILLLFGIIDGGRYLWEVNKAEKATQVGARVAVVTDVLETGLKGQRYLGQN